MGRIVKGVWKGKDLKGVLRETSSEGAEKRETRMGRRIKEQSVDVQVIGDGKESKGKVKRDVLNEVTWALTLNLLHL